MGRAVVAGIAQIVVGVVAGSGDDGCDVRRTGRRVETAALELGEACTSARDGFRHDVTGAHDIVLQPDVVAEFVGPQQRLDGFVADVQGERR